MGQPVTDPHGMTSVLKAGEPLDRARVAVIACHGRGASAEDILSAAGALGVPGVAYLAPQAPGHTWYPNSFLAPIERNQPHLSQALASLGRLVATVEEQGLPAERLVLLGFSQGACLALEFAARNARRYGAVVGLSGGLIGPPGTPRDYDGSLAGTPVFLGCSDRDPHIPRERVQETAQVLEDLGAEVVIRIYRGLGHAVNAEELEFARQILRRAGGITGSGSSTTDDPAI
jgi:predicted esterase